MNSTKYGQFFIQAKATCIYGVKCYQKSKKHRETYSHDNNSAIESSGKKTNDTVSYGLIV